MKTAVPFYIKPSAKMGHRLAKIQR